MGNMATVFRCIVASVHLLHKSTRTLKTWLAKDCHLLCCRNYAFIRRNRHAGFKLFVASFLLAILLLTTMTEEPLATNISALKNPQRNWTNLFPVTPNAFNFSSKSKSSQELSSPKLMGMTSRTRYWKVSNGSVVNAHPYEVLHEPHTVCDGDTTSNLALLIYVHTATDHIAHRRTIRRTWGNVTQYKETVRVVFVLGTRPGNDALQEAVDAESALFGDLLQESFTDSYKNLTYKAIAALKWVSNHCQHARYVMKTDDDVLINMFTLLDVLFKPTHPPGAGLPSGQLLCRVWKRMKVLRTGKWGVSEDDFPLDVYPPYCSGLAYIMTPDVAMALYTASYKVPFFWVDDVYITGLLSSKVPVRLHDLSGLFASYVMVNKDGGNKRYVMTADAPTRGVFSHINPKHIEYFWRVVLLNKKSNGMKFANTTLRIRNHPVTTLTPPVRQLL